MSKTTQKGAGPPCSVEKLPGHPERDRGQWGTRSNSLSHAACEAESPAPVPKAPQAHDQHAPHPWSPQLTCRGTGSTLTLPGPATPMSPKGWPPDPLRSRSLPSAVPALLNLRAQPTPQAPPAPAQHGHPGSVPTRAVLGPSRWGSFARTKPFLYREHRMYLPILEMKSNPYLSPRGPPPRPGAWLPPRALCPASSPQATPPLGLAGTPTSSAHSRAAHSPASSC